MAIAAHWYELDEYRILALPLFSNPAFTTHKIYLGAKFLGSQLSVPTASDCRWLATGGVYASCSAPRTGHSVTMNGDRVNSYLFKKRHSRNNKPERDARAELSIPVDDDTGDL